jgi:hypothetical protein
MTQCFERSGRRSLLVVGLLAGALAGCGGSSVVTVTGTVRHQGKPIPRANVTFTGLAADAATVPVGVGVTDDQGNFHLQTRIDGRDFTGVVPGEYRVSVSKLVPPNGMTEEEYRKMVEEDRKDQEAGRRVGPSLVPPRVPLFPVEYSDTQKSPLTATVGTRGTSRLEFDIP